MSEASSATERKIPAKKSAAKSKAAEPAPKQQEAQEQSQQTPFVRKEPGKNNFELKEVPNELKEAAQSRFGRPGVQIQMAPSRENGSYRGEVLNSHDYMAQKVGENSVVFHRKEDVELVSDSHKWMDREKKMNGQNLAIHYEGEKSKGFPHDPQREELNKLINTINKTAEKLNLPGLEQFKENMGKVKDSMLTQMKERRQEQKQDKAKPQEQQQDRKEPEHSR
jgi:hypothetical protein